MGSAVGQVPEYIEMVARWCKAHTRMPVIVKLTPNITDIRRPARAAHEGRRRCGVAHQHHQLDHRRSTSTRSAPEPTIDGKGTHGGYCGPAVKPIALSMVSEIARDTETHGMPISAIGGITTWRDAAEFMALGAGTVQVCTAAMVFGFKIVKEMIDGARALDGREAAITRLDDFVGRAVPNVTDWQYLNLNYVDQGAHRPGALHQVRPLPHRLRGHLAPGDHAYGRGQAPLRGDRRRMRRLQSLRRGLPGGELHHHGARCRPARSTCAPAAWSSRSTPTGRRTRTTRWRGRRRSKDQPCSPCD